nr:MAG TPA: hypothetical protein [Caudoviricetes sp.]
MVNIITLANQLNKDYDYIKQLCYNCEIPIHADKEGEFISDEDAQLFINKETKTPKIDIWSLIFDVTKDKQGFEKLYCEMVLYQTIMYSIDMDTTRLKNIEKYLGELIDEVSKKEI